METANAFIERLEATFSRVPYVPVFRDFHLGEARSLLPGVRRLTARYRDELKGIYEERFPITQAKQIARADGFYNRAKKQADVLNRNLQVRIDQQLWELWKDSHIQSTMPWNDIVGETSRRIKRDIAGYVWWEYATAPKGSPNPMESVLRLYELGVLPQGFPRVEFLNPEGKNTRITGKFVVDIPLHFSTAYSNIARGIMSPEHDEESGLRRPRMENGISKIEGSKISKFIPDQNAAILEEPLIMHQSTLATFIEGESDLLHLRYWSEDLDELRPIVPPKEYDWERLLKAASAKSTT